ncbi:hypothetical protein MNEG_13090 [Monoraphidium neglectum]|uniref:Prolyl 4-hydroxylase alpha subunit domain-containing protein n=1 Tax=Monoraphidium neglectum TaxID=145388 RepID=A0A0D2J4K2_9CHLO|nr:hypothetical protein MNEG_13090 [Monoraphidium neglectum]KIY94872.1 hypothetical protein MNEG_13090 [Monoraphidium neglectum]|eukprot:XP_013893892.1 hypothetical protein MNEG_13090 [Monoraphidium neglectum]
MGRVASCQRAPDWPKLSKKRALKAQTLGVGDHLFLVPGVLTVPEAQAFIDAAERAVFMHQGSRGAAYGEAFRDNDRLAFMDEALAAQLWDAGGLSAVFEGITVEGKAAVGLNPHIRFYRYAAGQKFGKHIDDSVQLAPGRVTRYTLLLYLSGSDPTATSSGSGGAAAGAGPAATAAASPAAVSASGRPKRAAAVSASGRPKRAAAGKQQQQQPQQQQQQQQQQHEAAAAPCTSAVQALHGGETVFYGARNRVVASVAPQPGLALLHLHGEDRCLEHEGAAVLAGTKYVLRSDVVFGAAR